MLMRSFTRREKILLLVLVLVVLLGVYVLAVHNPVQASLAEMAEEKEDLELQMDVAVVRQIQYAAMKSELEEIFAMPKDQLTVMPPYTNQRQEELFSRFNGIFMGLDPRISFPQVTFHERIASRGVEFAFNAPSYAQARALLTQLTRTGQRSLLSGLSIRPLQGDTGIQQGEVTVTGTIYFYELVPAGVEVEEG